MTRPRLTRRSNTRNSVVGRVELMLITGVAVASFGGCVASETPPTEPVNPTTSATVNSTLPPPVSASETVSIEPSVEVSEVDPEDSWGEYPPNHLDAARDLSDPQFPKELLTYTLDKVNEGSYSVIASYGDYTNYLTMGATVLSGLVTYQSNVASLQDVSYQGRAVCGTPTDFLNQTVCLMVGTDQVLEVITASEMPMEQVAAFTETIYDLL